MLRISSRRLAAATGRGMRPLVFRRSLATATTPPEERSSWREEEIMGASASAPPVPPIPEETASLPQVDSDVLLETVVEAVALGNWPSDYALSVVSFAQSLGLPWWGAIVATTLGLRSLMLPLSLETMKHAGRMQNAKPEIEVLQERAKLDASKDERRAKLYQRQMQAILAKHDIKVWLVFAFPMAQLPVFTSMFFGLQKLGRHFPDAAHGGALWFQDLTARDPYLALPIATSILFIGMIELGADGMNASSSSGSQQRFFKNVMRGLGVAMVPLTATMPASVFCYWLTANLFSLVQTTILNKVPGARKVLGLPLLPKNAGKKENIVTELREAWSNAAKAISAARKKNEPPKVAADVYDRKKASNAFLASRGHTPLDTYSSSSSSSSSSKQRKSAPPGESAANAVSSSTLPPSSAP
ncbi:hypothetical protein CTAYLR_007778 [Chrysophaeum taylorii]|uniref:Membrane insertase YidC/Oxa/ALB C-terminal domain-containing protein n=1 Tax=Chrysophaeum taylorii TaxID=2483200 RepID=A0AAD7UKL5_9STRA|nr:hypothetical protein CTAYLR_007778 [Chrysophaeum taylorii]